MRHRGVRGLAPGTRRPGGGSAAAGVPGVRLGGHRDGDGGGGRRRGRPRRPPGGGSARQPRRGGGAEPGAGVGHRPHRHGAHPLGHPRRADRPQRAPAPSTRAAASPSSTTGSSRTSPSCAPSSRTTASSSPATPTPRSSPTWSPAQLAAEPATLADAVRAVVPASGRRVHARRPRRRAARTSSSRRAATRRWSSGVGDGETFLGSDVAAFIEFTRDAVELGQDQVVEITRDGYTITDFARRRRRRPTPFHIDWDLAAAEKGGYDYFMLKEIEEQPDAPSPTPCAGTYRRADRARRAAARPGAARHRQGVRRRLRHRLPRRA